VLVVLVVIVARPRIQAWRAESRAHAALDALAACLSPHSTPKKDDLRARVLTADTTPNNDVVPATQRYPARCARHALALRIALADWLLHSGRAPCATADVRCIDTVGLLSDADAAHTELAAEQTTHAAALLQAANDMGLGARSTPASTAPEPAALFAPTDMRALYRGRGELLTDAASGESLSLLFRDPTRGYTLCESLLDGAAHCRKLAATIPAQVAGSLIASESHTPSHLLARSVGPAHDGVYDIETGEQIMAIDARATGGFVWRDGVVAVMTRSTKAPHHRILVRGSDVPITLDVPLDAALSPVMLWDVVLWGLPQQHGVQLHVAPFARNNHGALELAEPEAIGLVKGNQLGASMCRSDDTLALVVTSYPRGNTAIAFQGAAGWSLVRTTVASDGFGMTCNDGRVVLTWLTNDGEQPRDGEGRELRANYGVHRLECSPSGCSHHTAGTTLTRAERTGRLQVADMNETVFLAWRSTLGDVRVRFAKKPGLTQQRDQALYEPGRDGAFAWDAGAGWMFVRGGRALLIDVVPLEHDQGVAFYGFRISDDGIAPVPVAE